MRKMKNFQWSLSGTHLNILKKQLHLQTKHLRKAIKQQNQKRIVKKFRGQKNILEEIITNDKRSQTRESIDNIYTYSIVR